MSIRRLLSSLGATLLAKRFSSCQCLCANKYKVAVIGACGGIGQPLSLLMKLNPNVSELRLHDMEEWTGGVAADLSHIETAAKVSWTCGNNMSDALCGGVDIILVPAGMPRKPGMKRSDLFKSNAEVAFYAAEAMAKVSPGSILILVTNPVNALLPICCEVLKHYGKLCPQRVIGASTLDSVRAATFVAELTCADPKDITIPVVGGHSGSTILPLLSRANPAVCFDEKTADDVIKKIQQAGTTVLNAKKGHGTATLAMAYAASRLAFAIIRALNGEPNIVECCYVLSDVYPELKYMSTPLLFGKCGIEKNLGLGKLSDKEQKMFCAAVPAVQKDIEKGEQFAKEMLQKSKCK